jgi:hypothetical protein
VAKLPKRFGSAARVWIHGRDNVQNLHRLPRGNVAAWALGRPPRINGAGRPHAQITMAFYPSIGRDFREEQIKAALDYPTLIDPGSYSAFLISSCVSLGLIAFAGFP